jgi:hypothetical protein
LGSSEGKRSIGSDRFEDSIVWTALKVWPESTAWPALSRQTLVELDPGTEKGTAIYRRRKRGQPSIAGTGGKRGQPSIAGTARDQPPVGARLRKKSACHLLLESRNAI